MVPVNYIEMWAANCDSIREGGKRNARGPQPMTVRSAPTEE